VATLCAGLALIAPGIACAIRGELGVAPYDVLTTGLVELFGIPIGLAAVLLPMAFIGLGAALGSKLGGGTVLCVALVGPMLGLVLDRLPHAEPMVPRLAYFGGGFVLIVLGVSLTVVADIGSGPVELLMLAIHGRGYRLAPARTAIELTCVAVGWAIGGQVGVGTVVFALLLGLALRHTLTALGYDASRATEASDRAAPGA
jgi:uncharacterized membrane protein YczE